MSDTKSPTIDDVVIMHDANRISVALEEVQRFFVTDTYAMGDGTGVTFHADGNGGMKAYVVQPLDKPLPRRITAAEEFVEPLSFVDYVNRFKQAETIHKASLSKNRIVAQLDYHGNSEATGQDVGANTHSATLACPFDLDYAFWKTQMGRPIKQAKFIEIIEDYAHTVADPEAGPLIDGLRHVEFDMAIKTKAAVRKDGTQTIQYEEVLEQGGKGRVGSIILPEKLLLFTPVFQGSKPVYIPLNLRFIAEKGEVSFVLAPVGLAKLERDEFRQIGEDVRLATGRPVFYTL